MSGELQPGDAFAGHRIDAVAGRGGMGVVYRATQLDLDRTVALKLITPALAQDPLFRERFIRETRVAAGIDHPNVIPVFYAGEHEGRLYLAMRHVTGEDLRTLVRREGPLGGERAARILAQVASALDAAHAGGIVHRDVKPANILLGTGEHAYLTDFGLTKHVHSLSGTTRAGGWVGTLGYVSPEQIRGERVDARADVYALGCVLHHALTGTPPHQRESDEATLWAHLHEPPPPLGPEVPGPIGAVVTRALAKDPGDRFPSAGDLGRALLAAAGLTAERVPERVVATGAAAPPGLAPPVDEHTEVSPPGVREPPPEATTVDAGAPDAARRAHRSRPQAAFLLVAGLSLAVVLGIVALLVVIPSDPIGPATTPAGPRLLPGSVTPARLTATIPAGSSPNDIVATRRIVWAASAADTRLTRISAGRAQRLGTADVGVGVQSIATGYGKLWVAKRRTRSLLRLDAVTGERSGTSYRLPPGLPVVVATGQGGVWVALRDPDAVVRIDPATGAIVFTALFPAGVQDMAVGEGGVWVVNRGRSAVTRIAPATGATVVIPVGAEPRGIAVGDGAVWVCNSADSTVSRIDPRTDRVTQTLRTGDQPVGIDVGGGSVWVSNRVDGTVTRLSSGGTPHVLETIPGFTSPFAVAARGEDVWVTDTATGTVGHLRARS